MMCIAAANQPDSPDGASTPQSGVGPAGQPPEVLPLAILAQWPPLGGLARYTHAQIHALGL